MSEAYLVLITWPNGTEGLLFPKPGNVPLNCMRQDGIEDFEIAVQHLKHMAAISSNPRFKDAKIRLVRFERHEVVKEYPEPMPPSIPFFDPVVYTCQACGRAKSHIFGQGYVCEYCAGIED